MKFTVYSIAIAYSAIFIHSNANAQSYGTVKFSERFSDQSGETTRYYASVNGITLQEAGKRLGLMVKAATLANKLKEQYPDKFAGMSVKEGRFLTFDFKFANETGASILKKIQAFTTDRELLSAVSAGPAPRSAKATAEAASQLLQQMRAAGIQGEVARNDQTGELKALVRDPSAFQSGTSRGKISANPMGVAYKVEQFSGIRTTADISGGQFYWATPTMSCTMGFNVRQPATNVYGVSTAGHCPNSPARVQLSQTYSSVEPAINFVGEWYSLDIQWGYLVNGSGGVNWVIKPQVWNGIVNFNVTGGVSEYPGMTVCKYGKTTKITCGQVDPHAYSDSYGEFSRVNANSS